MRRLIDAVRRLLARQPNTTDNHEDVQMPKFEDVQAMRAKIQELEKALSDSHETCAALRRSIKALREAHAHEDDATPLVPGDVVWLRPGYGTNYVIEGIEGGVACMVTGSRTEGAQIVRHRVGVAALMRYRSGSGS